MYPFYDENYYMYDNSYIGYQRPPKGFYLQKTIYTALKGIQIANQMIPIIYQVKPLIDNTRNGISIIKAMRNIDNINVDEVVSQIVPVKEQELLPMKSEDEELFENMI